MRPLLLDLDFFNIYILSDGLKKKVKGEI